MQRYLVPAMFVLGLPVAAIIGVGSALGLWWLLMVKLEPALVTALSAL